MGRIKPMLRIVALTLSIALLGAACGGTSGTAGDNAGAGTTSSTTNSGSTNVAVDMGAPALTATLTDLLENHVYLASAAVLEAKLTKSTTSPEFKAAAGALDSNTVDLSKAIASVYGDAAGKQFLSLWRKHIGFFVDYAVGRLTGNTKQEDKAKKDLTHYKKDFAAFLDKATGGNLPANAAAASLQAHVDSLIEVINSVIDGKGDPFALLYTAANVHMPMTATALAGAIATQKPSEFPGKADSPGSQLNQTLTGLLDSHVYLASFAVLEAKLTKSTTSPEFKAAAGALDSNTVDLSKAIASVYGDAAGKQFLSLWRKHIGFFVDYAVGRLTGNTKQEDKAKTDLSNYKKDFAAFLDKATGGNLPANAAAASLQAHVDSLIEVINSVIDGKGDPFALLYTAAHVHMPMTATALAGAIAKQYPSKFPTN